VVVIVTGVEVRGAATKSKFSAAQERLALNFEGGFNLATTTKFNEFPLKFSGAGSHASITLFIAPLELHLPLFTFQRFRLPRTASPETSTSFSPTCVLQLPKQYDARIFRAAEFQILPSVARADFTACKY
jgi:hypothetical protein